jgi:probable F420-dependent oxidoreductase
MKVGYFAVGIGPLTKPAMIKAVALATERLGFSTLWAGEHVVMLSEFASKYPYSTGELPIPVDTPLGDPFTTLTYATALTSKIRLATGICLVPEHNPVVLAKTVATVDRLSDGRFVLGAGIGWLEEEFEAIGVTWERRAHRTREYIEAMRLLWSAEKAASYSGEFVNFRGALSYPKPVHNRRVPVWFGGESGPALRRVAEYGDGWIGFNLAPDEAGAKIKKIEELLKAGGRKRSEVELAVSPYAKPLKPDDLKRYRDAGVDEVAIINFDIPPSEREMVAKIEQIARDAVEPAAKI